MAEYIMTEQDKKNQFNNFHLSQAFRRWLMTQYKNDFKNLDIDSLEKSLKDAIK